MVRRCAIITHALALSIVASIVFGEPSASFEACEHTLNNPSTRRDFKAVGAVRSLDDFKFPLIDPRQRAAQFCACVAAIGEDMTQPGISAADRGERDCAAIAILDVGKVHDRPDKIALRVSDNMTLASVDLLAGVEAARAATFRRFHRLTVDDASEIACISQSRPAIVCASDFSLGHRRLRRIFANPRESQSAEITQPLFG